MNLILKINEQIINPLILVLMAVALLYFLWGVMIFIKESGEAEGRKIGRNHLVWGLIGLVIMVSVWAILKVLTGTLGTELPEVYRGM
jgi:hypothetical protein